MADDNGHSGILAIAEQMAAGGKNVVFTGAGISTESGIPDYRSKGGIWDRFQPVYFNEFMTSRDARVEYWRRRAETYDDFARARPNAGHAAVAELSGAGLLEAVITQNVDGLHQMSGLPDDRVVELHGNARRIRCMSCRELSSIEDAYRRVRSGDAAPECSCGGYLKPDTISFGQSMPEDKVTEATRLSRECDCFLVIGSTLLVQPAAVMPVYAKQHGAFLAIVNLSETPCDKMADVVLRAKAGKALPAIAKHARALEDGA